MEKILELFNELPRQAQIKFLKNLLKRQDLLIETIKNIKEILEMLDELQSSK